MLTAVALVISMFAMASAVAGAKKDATEGCTPGYWKNHTVAASSITFESVFGNTTATTASTTLQQAVGIGGGGLNALVRHAAAAYLNSLSGIDYMFSTAEVVALFQAALAPGGNIENTKNLLETANELGCPLN
jgi:hypothetical protein